MARLRNFGVLNVVAQPHPEGVYRQLFDAAALAPAVRFRGEQFARTSPVASSENGIFRGRLAIWTEIDPDSPAIDKTSFEQKLLSDTDIALPDNIGFNSKIFYFAFRERDHSLIVELGNDEGQSLSSRVAKGAFEKVLRQVSDKFVDDVTVHVATRRNAVEQVLGFKFIRKVEIVLDIPNPDDLSEDHQRVLDEIERMKAKQLKSELTKAAGEDSLELSPQYRILADLAKDNGYVRSEGRDETGEKIKRNTKDYPKELEVPIPEDASSYVMVGRLAENLADGEAE